MQRSLSKGRSVERVSFSLSAVCGLAVFSTTCLAVWGPSPLQPWEARTVEEFFCAPSSSSPPCLRCSLSSSSVSPDALRRRHCQRRCRQRRCRQRRACSSLLFVCTAYAQLCAVRVVSGLSLGGAHPLAYALVADLFIPDLRSLATACVLCASGFGAFLGQLLAAVLGGLGFTWQLVFLVLAPPLFAAVALYAPLVHRASQQERANNNSREELHHRLSLHFGSSSAGGDALPERSAEFPASPACCVRCLRKMLNSKTNIFMLLQVRRRAASQTRRQSGLVWQPEFEEGCRERFFRPFQETFPGAFCSFTSTTFSAPTSDCRAKRRLRRWAENPLSCGAGLVILVRETASHRRVFPECAGRAGGRSGCCVVSRASHRRSRWGAFDFSLRKSAFEVLRRGMCLSVRDPNRDFTHAQTQACTQPRV